MQQAGQRWEMHTKSWSEGLKEKKLLRKFRRRWEGNVRMDLGEIGCKDLDWIHLGQNRDQRRGCFEHGNELAGSMEDGDFLTERLLASQGGLCSMALGGLLLSLLLLLLLLLFSILR